MNYTLSCYYIQVIQWLLPVRRPEKMLADKKFSSNEDVFPETEAFFRQKVKSLYKSAIEML